MTKEKEIELRTKNEIKVDRFFSLGIYTFSAIGLGYFSAKGELGFLFICILTMFFGISVDKCNNDLEYKRYKK